MFPDEKIFFKQLEEKKLTLESLIVSAKSSAKAVELDQTKIGRLSRMDAIQRQAMAIETERRRKLDLRRVEAAIERLKRGDFGYCIVCDEKIPFKRLKFDPACTTCITCAK
tara:strand:- start:7 stop:339 length:333 start_codon:yes stop_codon:yes gene_type:complete